MADNALRYWVGLSHWPGFGYQKLQLLIKNFGSIKEIWSLGPKLNQRWQNNSDLDQELEALNKQLIKVITIEDKKYPKILKEINSPPFILYIKGNEASLNQPALAVVGTRKPTAYGQKAVGHLVPELAEKLVIVSGLARGIDSLAHRFCLAGGGKTVAVLGGGLDKIYPAENQLLAQAIVDNKGALISEKPLHYNLTPTDFPLRNRIIAGLSLGTLVIEGGEKSGTKITANLAADYGREVFCVPGPIDSPTAVGPAQLIQQGAKLVINAEDIWEELPLL